MIFNNNYKNRIQKWLQKKEIIEIKMEILGFFKEIESNDCALDFIKDMEWGCNGRTDTGCDIF